MLTVDRSTVYFHYGRVLSPVLYLQNKDIAFYVEPHSIHNVCNVARDITEQYASFWVAACMEESLFEYALCRPPLSV